jgi:hypothetical protein
VALALVLTAAGVFIHETFCRPVWPRTPTQPILYSISQLAVPMTALAMITFFIVFEGVLNATAELTRFADRHH